MGIIVLPGIIFALYAQVRVNTAYSNYNKVLGSKGYSGADVVRKMLSVNGVNNVDVVRISGELTDNYNPRQKVISLSSNVYSGTTISALGVAAHECGHALQDAKNYAPMKFRGFLAGVSTLTSYLLWPIIIIGLIFGFGVNTAYGRIFLWSGIAFFGIAFLFALITLPVELNASKRALKALVDVGALDEMEVVGAKEVLNAAALTYVAAMVISLLQLLRFLLIFLRRNDR